MGFGSERVCLGGGILGVGLRLSGEFTPADVARCAARNCRRAESGPSSQGQVVSSPSSVLSARNLLIHRRGLL